ncbi:MAG: hypothetical protein ABSB56_01740 [Nitrososphaerales archaeon]
MAPDHGGLYWKQTPLAAEAERATLQPGEFSSWPFGNTEIVMERTLRDVELKPRLNVDYWMFDIHAAVAGICPPSETALRYQLSWMFSRFALYSEKPVAS